MLQNVTNLKNLNDGENLRGKKRVSKCIKKMKIPILTYFHIDTYFRKMRSNFLFPRILQVSPLPVAAMLALSLPVSAFTFCVCVSVCACVCV